MTDDRAIRETIQVYFDAMFESDPSKFSMHFMIAQR